MKNIKIRKTFASLTILSLVLSLITNVKAITFQGSIDNSVNVSKYEAYSNSNEVLNRIPSSLEFEPMTYDEALKIGENENEFFSYLDYQLLDKINDIVKSNLAKINLTEEDYYLDVTDINTCKVFLLENKNFDKVIGEKEIKINYTGNYNTSDEQYVRNKVNQLDFNHILDYYDMTEEYTEDTYNRKQEEFVSTIKEMINDDTIDVIAAYGSAGGGGYGDIGFYATHVNFFKNNILFILASGFVFGGLHLTGMLDSNLFFLYLVSYSAMGIVFAYMLTKTNNIFVPMGFHFMHNGILMSLQTFILLFG